MAQSTELLCLVVVAIGLVTIAVHALVVSAGAPACAGLMLLCVVTVPAAVSRIASSPGPWTTARAQRPSAVMAMVSPS